MVIRVKPNTYALLLVMTTESTYKRPEEPGSSQEPTDPGRRRESDELGGDNRSEASTQTSRLFLARFPPRSPLCCSYRLLISAGAFIAFFDAALLRIGIVMAMVCMTDKDQPIVPDSNDCPTVEREDEEYSYEFSWSSELQGFITSGVFYGFLVGPFVGGFLSYRFGGRVVLSVGASCAGLTHALIPELTRVSPYFFFAIRILTGFFAGMIFPATIGILSNWTVPEERQVLVGGALIGVPLCSVVNFPLNGLLCLCCGWDSIFYSSTIWLIAFSFFSYFFMFDYPQSCPYINPSEKAFIVPKVPGRVKNIKVPWRKILTSVPIYSYILTHFCINYVFITVILHLPLFMKEVHHFQLSSNSFLSAAPYIGSLVMRIIITFSFNKVKKFLNVTTNCLRKTNVFIGVSVPMFTLVAICFIPCSYRYVTLTCFILFSITLEMSISGGYFLSLMDICPSYTQILSGVANAVANIAGLLSALAAGYFRTDGTQEEWNNVFYIAIGFLIFAGLLYILFGSNELQPWGLVKAPAIEVANVAEEGKNL